MIAPTTIEFTGAEANLLVATAFQRRAAETNAPILLVHGGGQTRHAWRGTARSLSDAGFPTISVDQRGHGESAWVKSRSYSFYDYAADMQAVCRHIEQSSGRRPFVVGASLGGVAALLAQGMAGQDLLAGLVLVDITPRMDPDGVMKIQGFMGARIREGFATLEEAADTIAAYLPHRERPNSLDGLSKNLRRGHDGRYRWHWDPAFIDGPKAINTSTEGLQERLFDACRRLTIPTMLLRGRQSELVTPEAAAEFCAITPHARFVDVLGAGHMVAGDRNDAFTEAVIDFLQDHADRAAS